VYIIKKRGLFFSALTQGSGDTIDESLLEVLKMSYSKRQGTRENLVKLTCMADPLSA
jgi:hypothetical protein